MAKIGAYSKDFGDHFDTVITNKEAGLSVTANAQTKNKDTSDYCTEMVEKFCSKGNGQTHAPRRERRHEYVKINANGKKDLAAAMLALDETRAVKFIEDFHTISLLIKMVGMVYDDMIYFFEDMTPKGIKQTVSNAEKDIMKLLNSVCGFVPKEEDKRVNENWTMNDIWDDKMYRVAELLRERINLIVNHAFEESSIWRIGELDNKLNELFTEEYLKERRKQIYEGVKERVRIFPFEEKNG